jgi:hypothetical protein
VLLDVCGLLGMRAAPSGPRIGPSPVAEPVVPDDKDDGEAQTCGGGDEAQGHRPHMPEADDIGAILREHCVQLGMIVLFDTQSFWQGRGETTGPIPLAPQNPPHLNGSLDLSLHPAALLLFL